VILATGLPKLSEYSLSGNESPHQDLAGARRLIETHGYHRRDDELADCTELFSR
jgi:hypothetical protein